MDPQEVDIDRDWQLPVLKVSEWETNKRGFVEDLRQACRDVGFFLLEHDIPESTTRTAIHETRRFFLQSTMEQKRSILYENHPNFRGYMELGVENTAGELLLTAVVPSLTYLWSVEKYVVQALCMSPA